MDANSNFFRDAVGDVQPFAYSLQMPDRLANIR